MPADCASFMNIIRNTIQSSKNEKLSLEEENDWAFRTIEILKDRLQNEREKKQHLVKLYLGSLDRHNKEREEREEENSNLKRKINELEKENCLLRAKLTSNKVNENRNKLNHPMFDNTSEEKIKKKPINQRYDPLDLKSTPSRKDKKMNKRGKKKLYYADDYSIINLENDNVIN